MSLYEESLSPQSQILIKHKAWFQAELWSDAGKVGAVLINAASEEDAKRGAFWQGWPWSLHTRHGWQPSTTIFAAFVKPVSQGEVKQQLTEEAYLGIYSIPERGLFPLVAPITSGLKHYLGSLETAAFSKTQPEQVSWFQAEIATFGRTEKIMVKAGAEDDVKRAVVDKVSSLPDDPSDDNHSPYRQAHKLVASIKPITCLP